MSSKSLKFIDKLKELLEEGIKIRISIAPYREHSLVSENNILSNHKKWEIQVEEFFEKHDKKQLLPKYFLKNQDLSIPPSRNKNGIPIIDMESNVFIKPERLEKLQNFRKDIDLALKEQLEILEKIINDLSKNYLIIKEKIIIQINEEQKEISRNKKDKILKYRFRKSGKNIRFEYILTISKNTKTGAKKLSNKTYQNISTEIKNINKIIKKELQLTNDLITNNNNTGYCINDVYIVEFI